MDSTTLEHDDFLRLLKSEREILRYVMAIVPHAADAQEVLQETAVALWKEIDRYDPSLPFAPWACRFAANKAKEHLRKQGRWNGFLNEEVASLLVARREQISSDLDRRVEPLRRCLGELPSDRRKLIDRYYFEQTSIEQIARDAGHSATAVYKSLQRIRAVLMDCVNGKLAQMEASQ